MENWQKFAAIGLGVAAGTIYGVISRLIFGVESVSSTLSIGFFLVTPFVLGFLTVMLGTDQQKSSWWYVLSAPWATTAICMGLAALFQLEVLICIIMASPIFLILASLGGLLAKGLWHLIRSNGGRASAIVILAVLPYVSIPIERLLPLTSLTRTIHSQIVIDASPEIVWSNITNLQSIEDSEKSEPFFYRMGLPRPIEAKMVCEEIGCIRTGMWEQGLSFEGTITRIEPGRTYWVNLKADTSEVGPAGNPLRAVGGSRFSMVDDGYEIEDAGNGRTILHLYSTYKLTTRVNMYGALWMDLFMRDIQGYILRIEKVRSEKQMANGG